MRRHGSGLRVGLEDVHLVAAVGLFGGVEGAVVEVLHRALSVAVATAIVGATLLELVAAVPLAFVALALGAVKDVVGAAAFMK